MKVIIWAIFVGVLLAGCGRPTIDATTDESMKSSAAKVREALPEARREKFDEAMQIVMFDKLDMKTLFSGAVGADGLRNKVKNTVHGKTGDQIIAEAEQIKSDLQQKKKEQALKEIEELEDKKTKSAKARKELGKFKVLRSFFYKKKQKYGNDQPVIELTVKNETSHSISRAYFRGKIASPKRRVPWHQDTFNYSISGGLEPGEQAKWSLEPSLFSGWEDIKPPDDAIFTVTVEELDGPDGKTLYSAKGFSDRDQKRLAQLKEKYSN